MDKTAILSKNLTYSDLILEKSFIAPFVNYFQEKDQNQYKKLQQQFLQEIKHIKYKYQHSQCENPESLNELQSFSSQFSDQQDFSSEEPVLKRKIKKIPANISNKFYCGKCQRSYSNACSLCFHIRTQHLNIVPSNSIMNGVPFTLQEAQKRNGNGKRGKRRLYRFIEQV